MCFCSVFSFPISRNAAESRANQETEGYVRNARVAVVDRTGEETGPVRQTRPPDLEDPLENRHRTASARGGALTTPLLCKTHCLFFSEARNEAGTIKGECEWLDGCFVCLTLDKCHNDSFVNEV